MMDTRPDIVQIGADLDRAADQLRVAAAAGGATVYIPPAHCVHLARRIEQNGTTVRILHVTVDYAPLELANILRAIACLLCLTAVIRLALPLARWLAAAL